MASNIYVGNLPYSATEDSLKDLFSGYGSVSSVKIIMDNQTGKSKGFGFVEMATEEEANKAIEELNGSDLGGRSMKVNMARPKEDRRDNNRRNGNFSGQRNY